MRWFIVFLLIANILLFFWVQQEALRPSSHSDIPPPEFGELRLLNEPPAPEVAPVPGPATAAVGEGASASDTQVEAAIPDTPAEVAVADTRVEPAVPDTPAETAPADTRVEPSVPEIPAEVAVADTQVDAAMLEVPVETAAADTQVEAAAPDIPADVAGVEQKVETPVAVVADAETEADVVPAAPMPAEDIPQTSDPAEAGRATEAVAVERAAEAEVPQVAVAQEDGPSPETEPPVAPPLPSPGGETMPVAQQKVAEPPVSEMTPEAAPVVATEPEPAVPAVCARVGPFEPADADELLQKLPVNFELLSDSSEDQTVDDGYYVLIPTLPDRATGLSRLKELKEAGFEDTWLFRRGAYRNAISLGLFRREGFAKRHAAKVAAKGFDVEVRLRRTSAERRWLQLKYAGEGDMQGALPLPDGVTLALQVCP